MKKITVIILILYSITLLGQTATIKAVKVFPDIKENSKFIKFNVNGHVFGEKDTIISVKLNTKGFDKCTAIINSDTLTFYTRFKKNEIYKIEQGCCCAAFVMTAAKNPRRGTFEFQNNSRKSLGVTVCESNQDTINSNKSKRIFASESAMCTFKPCEVKIVETEYFSEKYDYKEATYKELKKEQDKLVIFSSYFHFLNGEKIILKYSPIKNKFEMIFGGYLTDAEYNNEF